MSSSLARMIYHLFSLLALAGLLIAPAAARPARAETATPLVSDTVEEWAVGAGLIYWANTCYADEFNPFAYLKRKPAGGGATRSLESINDGARCVTFQNMLSSGDGLYYVSLSERRIERMPLSEPYSAQVVQSLSEAQLPTRRPALVAGGDYLYWLAGFPGTIFRTRKDGGGAIETVANTGASPGGIMVVGTTVYWSDNAGIWTVNTTCEALPCNDTIRQFSNIEAAASNLLYQFIGGPGGNYRVYWVERSSSGGNTTYQIRYRACNAITICYLLPPVGQVPPPPPSLYTATVNWQIGELLLANGNLYWTEADRSTVNSPNGDVKRKAYNSSEPGAETIATAQAAIDDRIFADGTNLFFARQNNGIYSLPLNATAIVRDFSADAFEVTQGIQNLANSAPLVAEKTTYVRAYARQISGPSTPNVEARLVGLRGSTPLPGSPLQPVNGVRSLTSGGSFDRARLNDGWYFLLPASWSDAGVVTLRLEIDARQIHSDPNRANNVLSQSVTFRSADPVCVMTVPVRTHSPLPSVYDPNFSAMVDQFERRWPTPDVWVFRDSDPVEELEFCSYYGIPYPCHGPYELSDGWGLGGMPDRDKVIASLWTRALLSFNPDSCDDIGAPVHYMGLVHPEADNGGAAGYASTISKQSWVQLPDQAPNPIGAGWDQMREGSVMAQELAHNYGRKHVDCNNPGDIDGNYPYPPCQIADVGSASYYGFDIATLRPIRPDQTADFMSYARRSWVSDYTWRALLNDLTIGSLSEPAANLALPGQVGSVFVTGLVDRENDRGAISSVLVLPADSVPPATLRQMRDQQADLAHSNTAQTYSLRLRAPDGRILVERPLALTPLDDHSPDGASALFSDMFDQPSEPVATIELLADGSVIDTRTPGRAAPSIAIQAPAAGVIISPTLTIAWTASDPDPADRLSLTVQYSHDAGASWRTVALDLPAGPDPDGSLTLNDLGSLPGSEPNMARIRILANDGYNTTIATSAAFTLSNRPPEPVIIAPAAGQSFAAGTPIVLRGSALDAEDGGLSGAALIWQVNGVAQGSGSEVLVAGLAPGTHTALLQARDAQAQSVSQSRSFQVEPLGLPLLAPPTLDGSCDDLSYSEARSLALKPYSDGAQATVRLLRSADHLWACFSGLQTAPADQSAHVGLRIDRDHSRDPLAQSDDIGFFAGEDGDVFTRVGDAAGGFDTAGPGAVQAQVAAGSTVWSAELRIDRSALDGWDHLIGLSVGHYGLDADAAGLAWPYAAQAHAPNTWATTALGNQPLISALEPYSATLGAPAFTLSIAGSGFSSGAVAFWNDSALPTTVVDDEQLTAEVPADLLTTAGSAQISVRSAAAGGFASNELPFLVQGAPPQLTQLLPNSTYAGKSTFTLTVRGNNFTPAAQVLWDGTALPTERISASELRAVVDQSLLVSGRSVGVSVRSPQSEPQLSALLTFTIEARAFELNLPLVIQR